MTAKSPQPVGAKDIAAKPGAQCIVTTSAISAAAAAGLFPAAVVLTYTGPVQQTDWTCLTGRAVVIMPTAGAQPQQAANWLANRVKAVAASIRVAEPEADRSDGWCLDDAEREGWSTERAIEWARQRCSIWADKPPELVQSAAVSNGAPIRKIRVQPTAPITDGAEAYSNINLADIWVSNFHKNFRFVAADGRGTWRYWSDDGWRVDKTLLVKSKATDFCRGMSRSEGAAMFLNAKDRRGIASSGAVAAVVNLSSAHPAIAETLDAWDSHPYLLGVPGGVVDLKTGMLHDARREDLLTMRTSVRPEYGEPVEWLKHLSFTQHGDTEKIGFLRRYFGLMLVGLVQDHIVAIMHGVGGSGKSAILGTFIKLMGDYGYAAPVELMMETKGDQHPTMLAALRWKRAVSCTEPPKGAVWDDSRIRSLTGGDVISARKMNQDFGDTFAPSHHLIVTCNRKPVLRSTDNAIKRRLAIIDFDTAIPANMINTKFGELLEAEAGQILQWAIEGCLEWQRDGLNIPDSMLLSAANYLDDEDITGQFFNDCFEIDPERRVFSSKIYEMYLEWCKTNHEKPMAANMIISDIKERNAGIQKFKNGGVRGLSGIKPRGGWDAS